VSNAMSAMIRGHNGAALSTRESASWMRMSAARRPPMLLHRMDQYSTVLYVRAGAPVAT
jgi:hypothetical protein